VVRVEDVPYEAGASQGPAGRGLNAKVAETEKDTIEKALKKTGGNKIKAAALLGISRPTLDAKMKKFGMKSK
jgi:DNA-binding NtrC family response regulator